MNTQQSEDQLWEIARKRAGFKKQLAAYVIVNAMLTLIWLLTNSRREYFWPVWPMLGWGIGLLFHYLSAYQYGRFFSAETEYRKLKQQ